MAVATTAQTVKPVLLTEEARVMLSILNTGSWGTKGIKSHDAEVIRDRLVERGLVASEEVTNISSPLSDSFVPPVFAVYVLTRQGHDELERYHIAERAGLLR